MFDGKFSDEERVDDVHELQLPEDEIKCTKESCSEKIKMFIVKVNV